jgi:hypothetical protein
MGDDNVLRYLFGAVDNEYIQRLVVEKEKSNDIFIKAIVTNEQKIQPVSWMIEANMYTKRELRVENVRCFDGNLEVHSFGGTTYYIDVCTE